MKSNVYQKGNRDYMDWVMIVTTDNQLKVCILCDKLTWKEINHRFEKVGVQYIVSVMKKDVKVALDLYNSREF